MSEKWKMIMENGKLYNKKANEWSLQVGIPETCGNENEWKSKRRKKLQMCRNTERKTGRPNQEDENRRDMQYTK